jgi:hypothetical protein
MNLQTARTELKGRGPKISAGALAIETVVLVSMSVMLVNLFT